MKYDEVCTIVLGAKKIICSDVSNVNEKNLGDYVTNIDIEVNEYIKVSLRNILPDVNFFSEEEEGELSADCWILDPIDGTANLVHGYNMSSISLAHYKNGEINFGIVYNPFTEECFTAVKGQGAYLNQQKRLLVSERRFAQSIVEFGAGYTSKHHAEKNFNIALEMFKSILDIRRICSSALAICYLADARIDGYFERVLKPWDFAAAHLILKESGGYMTDFFGNEVKYSDATSVLASNSLIHSPMQDIILKY